VLCLQIAISPIVRPGSHEKALSPGARRGNDAYA
jgi:hypothetical protein